MIQKTDIFKDSIQQKTEKGQSVIASLAAQIPSGDMFLKQQRFEIFLNKMDQLYRNEIRFIKKRDKKLNQMIMASTYSTTPLKEILKNYNELCTRGFDSYSMASTLEILSKVCQSRGNKPRVMGDYSLTTGELDQSWRMQKVCDDLKFALGAGTSYSQTTYNNNDAIELSASHMGQICNSLGDIGYKNTELIEIQFAQVIFFSNLKKMLKERFHQGTQQNIEDGQYNFEKSVFGSFKNYIPRYYIFQGFQTSNEFQDYLNILLEWEQDKSTSQQLLNQNSKHSEQSEIKAAELMIGITDKVIIEDTQSQRLQKLIGELIDASINVKELQKEQLASIETLRQQYFKMEEATDKHKFLTENPYIKYDILELQEMLVQGGYLQPSEQYQDILQNESFKEKMDRACKVFYDYVLNYNPEMVSPQYDQFYNASMEIKERQQELKQQNKINLEEHHNKLNLEHLSKSLIGISKQALSYRRDVLRKDYLSKFYEQYLMPLERMNNDKDFQHIKYDTVLMEREYLKAWTIVKDNILQIMPDFYKLVQQESNNLESQLTALLALSMSKQEFKEARELIINNCHQILSQQQYLSLNKEVIVDGLLGLALNPYQDNKTQDLQKKIVESISDIHDYTFKQQLDILWSLCILGYYDSVQIEDLVNIFNELKFERVDHELNYDEYLKVIDIYNALNAEGITYNLQLTNENLISSIKGQQLQLMRYNESHLFDPFKDKIVQGIAKGLTSAQIQNEVLMENDLFFQQKQEIDNINPEFYPYKPDIIMGFQGYKLPMFVLSEKQIFNDTFEPDGIMKFKMRIVQKLSQQSKNLDSNIKVIHISIPKIAKFNLEQFQLDFNDNFNLMKEINSQIPDQQQTEGFNKMNKSFDHLSEVCLQMIQQIQNQYQSSDQFEQISSQLQSFVEMIYKLFSQKQQANLKFDKIQQEASLDELKFSLMKLNLIYQNDLTPQCQSYINKFCPNNLDFTTLLLNVKESIPQINNQPKEITDKKIILDTKWIGTRQEVELPISHQEKLKKDLAPEMINQRFMWIDDYFHYDDWQLKQKSTFDNFNLLIIPHHKRANKFFFDRSNHMRRIPQGIFPNPNFKRKIIVPQANNFMKQLQNQQDVSGQNTKVIGHDEFVLFEKEPYKMMVINELKKSEEMQPINDQISFITNLQNIKQSLKSDYSDKEILRIILLNLSFTEDLIIEHLNQFKALNKKEKEKEKQKKEETIYVERDPSKFREFKINQYYSKDKEDPYTDFYIKEAAKIERIKNVYLKEEKSQKSDDSLKNQEDVDKAEKRSEEVDNIIDKMLLQNEMENQDLNSLGHSLKQNVKVKYDIKSLMKSEFISDIDPQLKSDALTDIEYLSIQRRKAEQKLIKMKIIYKLHEGNETLTENEKQYLKHWHKDIINNQQRNIMNISDSLLPDIHTSLTINDVDAKSIYTLNSLRRVNIDRDKHNKFSLNDLVLELSNFLDEQVVNKVELGLFSQRLKKEWNLAEDFSLIEDRNKEIGIIINELEEVAFRMAGMFDDKDYSRLMQMLSIKRNQTSFDKYFFKMDMDSLKEFISDSNSYDERIKMVEQWIDRKETEFLSRVVLPNKNLNKSDQQIYSQIDKDMKKARESIVSKMLANDSFGNQISKSYNELTSLELSTIVENVSIRLYMFNYEYPEFLSQIVRAIIEHPNILQTDKNHLEIYCKMFELDWKGDQSYQNKQEFMANKPIYLQGDNIKEYLKLNEKDYKIMLKRACVPYVQDIANSINQITSQN